jgi:hypothetical protein
MIGKTVLAFTPGATTSQKEKAASRLAFPYAGTCPSMQTRRRPAGERGIQAEIHAGIELFQ